MKQKLLILPSWYITPNDRINGSFFQAQGALLSSEFDTRVLHVKIHKSPPLSCLFSRPKYLLKWWIGYLHSARSRVDLPDEEVFLNPEALLYCQKLSSFSERGVVKRTIATYLVVFDELYKSGWRPDLIKAHTVYPAGVVAREIKARYEIPYILSEHMPFTIFKFPSFFHDDIRRAFEEADRVLSLGYDKVRQVCMSDIDIEPHIIFNFIDEIAFSSLSSGYQPFQPLKLISIGAASHYKDHPTLLRALALLKCRDIPFELTLIGLGVWGKRRQQTLGLIKDLQLDDQIHIVDKMSRKEVADALAKHQVFLLTSIQEGFPNAVLEALASGLFVVATRHGGTEDLLTEDVGRVVPIKSPVAVADVLENIYRGNIAFEPVVIRDFVVRVCGRSAYAKRLSEHYRAVIAGRGRAVSGALEMSL